MQKKSNVPGIFKWGVILVVIFSPLLVPPSVTAWLYMSLGVMNATVMNGLAVIILSAIGAGVNRVRSNMKWLNAGHFDDDKDINTVDLHLYNPGDGSGDYLRGFMPTTVVPGWWNTPVKWLLDPWLRYTGDMDMATGLIPFTPQPIKFLSKDQAGKCKNVPDGYSICGIAARNLIAMNNRLSNLAPTKRTEEQERFLLFYSAILDKGIDLCPDTIKTASSERKPYFTKKVIGEIVKALITNPDFLAKTAPACKCEGRNMEKLAVKQKSKQEKENTTKDVVKVE